MRRIDRKPWRRDGHDHDDDDVDDDDPTGGGRSEIEERQS